MKFLNLILLFCLLGIFQNPLYAITSPANTTPAEAASSSQIKLGQTLLQLFQDKIDSHLLKQDQTARSKGMFYLKTHLNIQEVAELQTPHQTQIEVAYKESGLHLTYQYTPIALENPELLLKDMIVLSAITNMSPALEVMNKKSPMVQILQTPFAWVETSLNAREGSLGAKARLALYESLFLKSSYVPKDLFNYFFIKNSLAFENKEALKQLTEKAYNQIEIDSLNAEKNYERFKNLAQKNLKIQSQNMDIRRKDLLNELEQREDKLNDLILKNDRKGVRQLIEAYLPWEIMEPLEIKAWNIWLEAIEFPRRNQSVIAFRGLDFSTDKIQRSTGPKGEQLLGFMSTLLTKNQGSYTRRLRTLTTTREKFGDELVQHFPEGYKAFKLADQMTLHSRNPVGSPFISFSNDPVMAMRFIKADKTIVDKNNRSQEVPEGGFLAVKIDARRMFPNIFSVFSMEYEILTPLIIFPDEVLGYHEGDFIHPKNGRTGDENRLLFLTSLTKNPTQFIERKNLEPLREKYAVEGYKFLEKISFETKRTLSCRQVFKN